MASEGLRLSDRNPALSLAECEDPLYPPIQPSLPSWLCPQMTVMSAWLALIQDGRGVCTALPRADLSQAAPCERAGRAEMTEVWCVSSLPSLKMADVRAGSPSDTMDTACLWVHASLSLLT